MTNIITNELKNEILAITGIDRQDCINKVANLLNANVGDHIVEVKTSKNIVWGNLIIDLSTRKKKGLQTIKSFMTWEINDKAKTIKMYF